MLNLCYIFINIEYRYIVIVYDILQYDIFLTPPVRLLIFYTYCMRWNPCV